MKSLLNVYAGRKKGVLIMDNKLEKILKIIAVTGIVTAGIISVAKSGMIKEMLQKMKQKMKQDNDRERMILIAKKIDMDIKNTVRRTSPRYHERNQEKYDNMDWNTSCENN